MKRILLLSLLTLMIIGFQNCSKIQLQALPQNKTSSTMDSVDSNNTPSSSEPGNADRLLIPNNPTPDATTNTGSITNTDTSPNTSSSMHMDPSTNPDVYYYQINLTTGGISAYDFNDGFIKDKNYCLSESELSELKSILKSSSICDSTKIHTEDEDDNDGSDDSKDSDHSKKLNLSKITKMSKSSNVSIASENSQGENEDQDDNDDSDDSDNDSGRVCSTVYKEPYATLLFGENEVKLGEAQSGCDEPVDLCGDHKILLKIFITNLLKNINSKACSFESVSQAQATSN